MHFRSLITRFGLFVSVSASLDCQTTATISSDGVATVRAKARLVLVDLVVTNDKGDRLTGLEKTDSKSSRTANRK